MDNLKTYVSKLQDAVTEINSEIAIAETKGVFAYPRSKNIRKQALLIAKSAKNIREACLTLYKGAEQD